MRVMREDGRGGEATEFARLNEPQAASINKRVFAFLDPVRTLAQHMSPHV